ncbi:C39 family peptidase [Myxococcota bacterium]|nr:C39 family peptidase [Myxococcota bacterium]
MRPALALLLLAACAAPDPDGGTRQGPGEGDGGAADGGATGDGGAAGDGGGGDGGATGDGGGGDGGGEQSTCVATSSRARCTVIDPGDHAGDIETEDLVPGIRFDAAVPSWNAETPPGSWIEVQLAVRVDGTWTDWYELGKWASGDDTIERQSVEGQSDAWGRVYTDTLVLSRPADAARLRVVRHGDATVSRLALAVADQGARDDDEGGRAWGTELDLPDRSQMEFSAGEAWCSPTSVSMVLGFHADRLGDPGIDVTVPDAADATWDAVYEGNGNWPFNTAFAATRGLSAEVGWLGAMSQVEPWIAAGHPVVISAAWEAGELDDAAISSTDGHLLVVRGFTADGDVAVNDPAASSDDGVARVYDRQQLEDAWLGGSGGVVYLIWEGPRPE